MPVINAFFMMTLRFVSSRNASGQIIRRNAEPAYAEGFGVAGAHLSRRSDSEGGTPNVQLSTKASALREAFH
jgi:hypothetical protein